MTEIAIAITGILSFFYGALHLYYFVGWQKSDRVVIEKKISEPTFISVIVVARNEQENILRCVNSILKQNYPTDAFELIVIDDHSTDNTFRILSELDDERLKVLSLKEYADEEQSIGSYKKYAITQGVSSARGTLIATTDADCIAPSNWLSLISTFHKDSGAKMIAGPVDFISKNNWISILQELDLIGLMGITAGSMTNGIPTMCNGANLVFEKEVFKQVGGYTDIDDLPSGDDILLMMKIKDHYPDGIYFLNNSDAIVKTNALDNWTQLWQQRLRWLSKASRFQDKRLTMTLILAYLFYATIPINLAIGFWQTDFFLFGVIAFAIKMICEIPLLIKGSRFFDKTHLLKYVPIVQPVHLIYSLIVGLLSQFLGYSWKGRKYSHEMSH